MPRTSIARVLSVLFLAGVLAGLGAVARARYLPDGATLPGLRIDGETVEAGVDLRALVESRVASLRARKVRIVLGGEAGWPAEPKVLPEVTLGELGVDVDVDAVVS